MEDILKLALEQVGRADLDSLLDCRLVCHAWNKAAVQILEKRGCAIELDYDKMLQFKALLWNKQLSRTYSNANFQQLHSLGVSLDISPNELHQGFSNTAEAVQLLMHNPHIRLTFIHLNFFSKSAHQPMSDVQEDLEMFSLLKLASRSLKCIEIYHFDGVLLRGNSTRTNFEDFEFDCYSSLEFPRLTCVNYHVSSSSSKGRTKMQDLARILASAVQRAPKLTKLNLDIRKGNSKQTIKSLRIMLGSYATNLEKLEFRVDEHKLKLLEKIKFPNLKMLGLKHFALCFITTEFNQFLEHNCPALTGFEINLFLIPGLPGRLEIGESLNGFPVLPNILHFGLFSVYRSSPECLQYIHTIFTRIMTKFPSICSLDIDVGILFMLGNHLSQSGHLVPPLDEYPSFPNISTLKTQTYTRYAEMSDFLEMTAQIYHHTFPNMENLTIQPDDDYISCGENAIGRFIEFLCYHPGIEYLEIHNYGQVWLEQITTAKLNLQKIRKLKLLTPRVIRFPPMDIPEVLARFPTLEFLQYGKEMVSGTELQVIRTTLKRFEHPISKYKKNKPLVMRFSSEDGSDYSD